MRKMMALRFECPHCGECTPSIERIESYKEWPDRGVEFMEVYAWRWPCCGDEEVVQGEYDEETKGWTKGSDPNNVWDEKIKPHIREYEVTVPDKELFKTPIITKAAEKAGIPVVELGLPTQKEVPEAVDPIGFKRNDKAVKLEWDSKHGLTPILDKEGEEALEHHEFTHKMVGGNYECTKECCGDQHFIDECPYCGHKYKVPAWDKEKCEGCGTVMDRDIPLRWKPDDGAPGTNTEEKRPEFLKAMAECFPDQDDTGEQTLPEVHPPGINVVQSIKKPEVEAIWDFAMTTHSGEQCEGEKLFFDQHYVTAREIW